MKETDRGETDEMERFPVKWGLGTGRPAAVVLLLVMIANCGGGGSSRTENLFTVPDWIGREASGKMLVAEKVIGNIWEVDPGSYEVIDYDAEEDGINPAFSWGTRIVDLDVDPAGEMLAVLLEAPGGCTAASYRLEGFQAVGSQEMFPCPLAVGAGNGGEVILLMEEGEGAELVRTTGDLALAGAVTVPVFFPAERVEVSPSGERVLLRSRGGEGKLGWVELESFTAVEEMTLPGEVVPGEVERVQILPEGTFPGRGVFLISGGRDRAITYLPGQDPEVREFNLQGITGGITAGNLGGEAVLAWVTVSGYLYLAMFESGCYHDFGQYQSLAGEAAFTGGSDPTITEIETSNCLGTTKTETWTITFEGDAYRVEGTVSGLQIGTVREGEKYTSDNGEITFLIEAGEKPTENGDQFVLSTDDGIGGMYVGATARTMFIEPDRGVIWVVDQAQGRIVVVEAEAGEIAKVIE